MYSISSEYITGNTIKGTDFRFYRIWVIKEKFFGKRFFGEPIDVPFRPPPCTKILDHTTESQRDARCTGTLPLCHTSNTFTFLIPNPCPTLGCLRPIPELLSTVYEPHRGQHHAMTCPSRYFFFYNDSRINTKFS